MPRPQVPLRDYFRDDGVHPPVVLADYVGDQRDHRGLRRVAEGVARANTRMVDNVTGIPQQWQRDLGNLSDPLERKLLFRAFFDDALQTDARRRSMVSILVWAFVIAWAVAGLVVTLVARPALPDFHAVYNLFFYGVATSLFLPLPFETLLSAARLELGIGWTVLVASLSKVAGAWLVLLMGDRAHEGLEQGMERFPRVQQAWTMVVAWAQRYGYTAVFILFAIPFMSDTLPLFMLAVMHMRKGIFLTVTFVAIAVRCLFFFFVAGFF